MASGRVAAAEARTRKLLGADSKDWLHAVRTTVAAVGSLLLAQTAATSGTYWAANTSMIVMQSTLGAAWTVSKQRLAGTALGATRGALLVTYVSSDAAAFGAGVFLCGAICAGHCCFAPRSVHLHGHSPCKLC